MKTISLNLHPSARVCSLVPEASRTLDLVLTRTRTIGEYTEGQLTIEGVHICSTLENSNSRVPAGEYSITLLKCKQYSRKMLCLNANAPCLQCKRLPYVCNNTTLPCYCPQIKPGNGVHNRLETVSSWESIIA